ncbi:MAG TPA: NUDIX domain-containing protein [Gemmata sp.]|nr:NUDIX domain-containing protein [Gemmata sp.]
MGKVSVSAGVLLFRRRDGQVEVLLAHPGGPFWAKRDAGAWTIPKGLSEAGEDLLAAARREFAEETGLSLEGPFLPLGNIRQKAGKVIHAWACEGDADPASLTSNLVSTEWPPRSGRRIEFPEVDRCAWFSVEEARAKLNPAQTAFIDRLEELLSESSKKV